MQNQTRYTEDELIEALQKRNQKAFSYLYDNYAGALNGAIFKLTADKELAEDILQEVFLKIWNNIASYEIGKGRLFTWMLKIAQNTTIDTFRSKGYKNQMKIYGGENSESYNIGITDRNIERLDGIGLDKQLHSLKPEYKSVIEMAYFKGYTQDEISKILDIPLGTVKTRIRSAILELKSSIVK